MVDWATALVFFGLILTVASLAGWAAETFLFAEEKEVEPRATRAEVEDDLRDGEPTDDEIYNGYGREGGIAYDPEPAYDEHDWRL